MSTKYFSSPFLISTNQGTIHWSLGEKALGRNMAYRGLYFAEDSTHMVEAQIAIKGLQGHNLRVWAVLKDGDRKGYNIEGEFIEVREVFF